MVRRHLQSANHAATAHESHGSGQQSRTFLDCALDEFRDAAERGFTELGGNDEPAGAESNQFAGWNASIPARHQCFLPAQNAVKDSDARLRGIQLEALANVGCIMGDDA